MEETEDEIETNILLLSDKKNKSKSSKSNNILKKYKRVGSKDKYKINNVQSIFNKEINNNNNPLKMIFTADNSIKPLPLLSSASKIKNNNNDKYLIINDEMKINKNIFENNLFNLLKNKFKNKKTKSQNNIKDKYIFKSLIFENSIQLIKKDDIEKEVDSVATEEQKSIESFYGKGKGTTSPSSNGETKRRNLSFIHKKKRIKIRSLKKSNKKKISLIKILNKPFCFLSSKINNNNNLINENINFNFNNNFGLNNNTKIENKRYNNINNINNTNIAQFKSERFNNIRLERVKSSIMKNNIPIYQNKKNDLHLTKNRSAKNMVNNKAFNDPQSSLYQFKLNLLRSKVSNQINQFSIYHFYKSHNIYIFIKNSKYKNDNKDKNNISTSLFKNKMNKIYEIEDDFYLPGAYRPRVNKWPKMPECIENTCKNGGITLVKNIENCNIIWKLIHPNKMRQLIRLINNCQKYNHYPTTFQLGRKDNLYKHFKYFKRLFPELYNFVPSTYIIPSDGRNFENSYKKNRKALWIVKPVNMSRGRGVHILKDEAEFKFLLKKSKSLNITQYLISRYIDKPHLINKKKYDLRIYVLVASFSPLRIYLCNNGLVRFATEDFKRGDFNNVYIHLTNYSINKNNIKYKPNQNIIKFPKSDNEGEGENIEDNEENEVDDDSSKWSLVEYRYFFQKIGKEEIMDKIWKQIEDIVIKTILSVSEDYYKEISINKINSLFELYGFDIMIDENFKAWLLEVNVNPSLHCTSPLDLNIKTDLITDIFNIVGIIPYNHNNNGETIFNYLMKKTKFDFDINNNLFPKLRFTSNNFFNFYNDLENYINNNKNNASNNGVFSSINNNSLMTVKSIILRNFNPYNLRQKLPEYDNEFYKKIIEIYEEEKARSELTNFNLIFPLKNNIEFYSKILIKSNSINDSNIVIWEYILNDNNL